MKLGHMLTAFVVVLALSVRPARAQRPQDAKQDSGSVTPDSPLPPVDATPQVRYGQMPTAPAAARAGSPNSDSQPYDPAQVHADTHTLSGAELFSVGSLGKSHTIFDPSLYFTETGTNGIDSQGTSLSNMVLLGGTVKIDHTWGVSRLVASYNGGETIFIPHVVPNTQYHDFSIEDAIMWYRLTLRVRDDLAASPYAIFGGQGMGGPGVLGQFSTSSQTAISSTLVTSQIQTGQALRLLDTALGEVDYELSRQATVSFSGSYGLLHFTVPGFIDSHSLNTQVGFDYMVSPKNSIAVIGAYGKTDFGGSTNSTNDYIGQLAFGRKVTGKVALQLAAGPEQIQTRNAGSVDFQFLSWSTNVAISYNRRRTGFSLYYAHGLTNGSGLLTGALSHTFSASVSRTLTRHWSGSLNGGYALDRSIATPLAPSSFSFTHWYSGANIGRTLGRHVSLNFNYSMAHQRSPDTCPDAVCGGTGYAQIFGTTVNWHLRRTE